MRVGARVGVRIVQNFQHFYRIAEFPNSSTKIELFPSMIQSLFSENNGSIVVCSELCSELCSVMVVYM